MYLCHAERNHPIGSMYCILWFSCMQIYHTWIRSYGHDIIVWKNRVNPQICDLPSSQRETRLFLPLKHHTIQCTLQK